MPKKPAPRPTSLKRVRKIRRQTVSPPSRGLGVAGGVAAAAAGLLALNVASAHVDISSEASSLQSSLSELETRGSFGEVQSDIINLDSLLNRVVDLLESARDKDYRYQGDMEEIAYNIMSQWESVRPQVEDTIRQQAYSMQGQLPSLNPHLRRLNSRLYNATTAAPLLRSTQSQVNSMLQDISRIERNLENSYDEIETKAYKLNSRLTDIHWALDQLSEAKFNLDKGEDLVMAVPTRWDKKGKDDPEGVLYLSNKRMLFERKEKVATKKVLFITMASELVQEVLIDRPLDNVRGITAKNKGLFGHQDFLLVEFTDKKLKEVSFHLNGQDSKDWAILVERARSGQIEDERVSGAVGLSVGDLTRSLSTADILSIQNEVNSLQDEMMLKDSREGLSDLENEVRTMERQLADVRAKGYEIEKDLEADIAILTAQWDRVKKNAETTIDHQTGLLSDQMRSIQQKLSKVVGMSANLAAARPLYMQVKSAIASAEAQADAAEDTVLVQFDEYADEVESLTTHLDWVGWMLEALSSASFRLLATESGVAATEAVFQHPSWEPENGVLFLTDQRLLWEDRVGTYELKVDVPLQEVLKIKRETDEQEEQEFLVFSLGSQSPVPTARFELALPVADDWLKMVGRAKSGGYVQDRAVTLSEEELERVRNAPQQCFNCGAAFTAPILRGQTEINCEYCGVVTRF